MLSSPYHHAPYRFLKKNYVSLPRSVLSPQGDLLWQQPAVATEAHFNVAAKGPGSYRACFFNAIDSYR